MGKFKPRLIYPSGETDEAEEVFDTREEAFEAGSEMASNSDLGAEILQAHNPGDYVDLGEPEVDVIEVTD